MAIFGVHIDTQLLEDVEFRQTLDGLVQIKTSPLLPAPDCTHRFFRLFSSDEYLGDLVTMSLNDLHFSAYLFTRQPGDRWTIRFYTVDKLGMHSRKAACNPVRGPHIKSVDLQHLSEVRMTDGCRNRLEILRKGSNGKEAIALEIYSPSDDIAAALFDRIHGLLERIKTLTFNELEEQARINRSTILFVIAACRIILEISSSYHNNMIVWYVHVDGCWKGDGTSRTQVLTISTDACWINPTQCLEIHVVHLP